ncbi:hypothetical protein HHI36_004920 [Cryptolaemus montrouzieri]|uniref:Uncharacterized protein n=1 Tax=Cryptolaemus montrouzieri TaxID=559131 RepID=A0ABD2NSN3_9CUCU
MNIETVEEFKDSQKECKYKNLSLIHNNMRSMTKNFDEFDALLYGLDWEIDCMVLSETWATCDISLYERRGYETIYSESMINQNDGLLVFMNENLDFDYRIVSVGELKAIVLDIFSCGKRIQAIAIYLSPSRSPVGVNIYNDQIKFDMTLLSGILIKTFSVKQ